MLFTFYREENSYIQRCEFTGLVFSSENILGTRFEIQVFQLLVHCICYCTQFYIAIFFVKLNINTNTKFKFQIRRVNQRLF